jgi:UDP-glucose 4-epimerase
MESSGIFFLINTLLIIVIIVLGVVSTMRAKNLYATKTEVTALELRMNGRREALERRIATLLEPQLSLLDLQEFNGLSPTVKDAYKKYIVQIVMKSVIEEANPKLEEYIKANEAEIARQVASIVKQIKSADVDALAEQVATGVS